MKIITFAVPCYNSAAYMQRCIRSLLDCGRSEDIEIILIDDGSTDDTGKIADEYAERCPSVIRVIHQENGGHGEGVNQGLKHAQGLYYKVVDSDDWLDSGACRRLISQIKRNLDQHQLVDLYVCNYVYEHEEDSSQRVIRYRGTLPENRIFTWKETRSFKPWQYLLMHSLVYRTKVLKDSGLLLPKHTFYVDNLFAYIPLPYVRTFYYMDLDLYRYYIGRADQSVNESIMIRRIDQQLRVTRIMIRAYDIQEIARKNKKCANYMLNYLMMMVTICSVLLILDGSKEALQKKQELWRALRQEPWYRYIRLNAFSSLVNLPGCSGRRLCILCYRAANKIFKFN